MTERAAIELTGRVQGVGFRPFVHSLATALDLRGFVQNRGAHVLVDVEGDTQALATFVDRVVRDRPPLSNIEGLHRRPLPTVDHRRFVIADSEAASDARIGVPLDVATCDECLSELFNPNNRRYRHPFVACASCGPRYSMLARLPFDRARTAMGEFAMCQACAAEYGDPSDRRFHAQGLCCPGCGPRLAAGDGDVVTARDEEAPRLAAAVLTTGGIVAVQGIGGFHLACDATDGRAVAELRRRKRRERKPFAVMLPWAEGRDCAQRQPVAARTALLSAERPIVVVDRESVATFGRQGLSRHVAPGSPGIGVFLPYSPIHHLLLSDVNRPLVMTSGNRCDEPMACDGAAAAEQLRGVADLFLTHDREIVRRCDDSVVRARGARLMPIRHGRGSSPLPLTLAEASPRTILGVGGDLKNAFCFVAGTRAWMSSHVGTLDSVAGLHALQHSVGQLATLLDLEPALVVHDRHPDSLATRVADQYPDAERVAVQHHHAHVLSCAAEHRWTGPVIGVAFDGAGLGDDGAVWGGEFLVVEGTGAHRAAHLGYVPLPGGDAAAREPWRVALAHSIVAGAESSEACAALAGRIPAASGNLVRQLIVRGTCSPPTSSMGRLFDAVAALVGICDVADFEGQAAMALEAAVSRASACRYSFELDTSREPWTVEAAPVIRGVAADAAARRPIGEIAAAFHDALAEVTVRVACRLAERTGIRHVALTGGVFQNARLVESTAAGLSASGLTVLEHRRVPCNDGGLSLGHAVFGARLLRERGGTESRPCV